VIRKRKSAPMETQPASRPSEVATPMVRVPSKRSQTTETIPSPVPASQAETSRKRPSRSSEAYSAIDAALIERQYNLKILDW
jgi:hypothetical protein